MKCDSVGPLGQGPKIALGACFVDRDLNGPLYLSTGNFISVKNVFFEKALISTQI